MPAIPTPETVPATQSNSSAGISARKNQRSVLLRTSMPRDTAHSPHGSHLGGRSTGARGRHRLLLLVVHADDLVETGQLEDLSVVVREPVGADLTVLALGADE